MNGKKERRSRQRQGIREEATLNRAKGRRRRRKIIGIEDVDKLHTLDL